MNFNNSDITTFMFIVGVLFIIGGFVQFVDWIDIGIGAAILLLLRPIVLRYSLHDLRTPLVRSLYA
jgi:hypothetical protein